MSLKLWTTRPALGRRRCMLAAVIVPCLIIGAMAGPSLARSARSARSRTVDALRANQIGGARFGELPGAVISRLDWILGRRPSARYHAVSECQVDHVVSWPGLAVFFRRRRFVGYSYRTANGGALPTLATGRGLRVGDTLTRARQLYGRAFHNSAYHGGSWWASTDGGLVKGFVSGWPGGPRGSVATIAAGQLGCPATTP